MGEGDQNIVSVAVRVDCRIHPRDSALLEAVDSVARVTGRPARPVHLQSLLQLPRLANADGVLPLSTVRSVMADIAAELPPTPQWTVQEVYESPRQLAVRRLEAEAVEDVFSRFHYLRSPRTDGRTYGLMAATGELVAVCVSSPVDVDGLFGLLEQNHRPSETTRVISRVFAFEGAPRNSLSYLLARVSTAEAIAGITDFLTYVNPNMGFTGSSYLASGWKSIGVQAGTRYRYLDERYITDRQLAKLLGKHTDVEYSRIAGARFAVSSMPLAPLLVFHTAFESRGALS